MNKNRQECNNFIDTIDKSRLDLEFRPATAKELSENLLPILRIESIICVGFFCLSVIYLCIFIIWINDGYISVFFTAGCAILALRYLIKYLNAKSAMLDNEYTHKYMIKRVILKSGWASRAGVAQLSLLVLDNDKLVEVVDNKSYMKATVPLYLKYKRREYDEWNIICEGTKVLRVGPHIEL